ncbi:MAG: ABC-type transport auxiliary lipoprotein family protein [Candidatus Zhuqueibacterota bacterium]
MAWLRYIALCVLIMGFVLLLAQCSSTTIHPKYYILDYRPVLRDSSYVLAKPFPYRVQVQTMKIPRTFDRVSIVVRYSAHRLDYYRYNLWAIRPQITISDLIAEHINSYRIFQQCQREFFDVRPDYEIVGSIEAIEKFDNESYTAAHLALKLYLRSYDGYENLLSHEFEREEEIATFKMELFAKKLSDILNEETDVFIKKMIVYFQSQTADSTTSR